MTLSDCWGIRWAQTSTGEVFLKIEERGAYADLALSLFLPATLLSGLTQEGCYPQGRMLIRVSESVATLQDIPMAGEYCGKGIGSCLMNHAIRFLRASGVRQVHGELSRVDWDHVDRLVHFYQKHGFVVETDHRVQCGYIRRKLESAPSTVLWQG